MADNIPDPDYLLIQRFMDILSHQNNSPPLLRRLPGQRDTTFVDYRVIPYMSPIKKIIFNDNINESYYIHEDAI